MKNIFKLLILFFVLNSCNKDSINNETKIRTDFITNKTRVKIKETFKLLNYKEKTELWINKLEQLKTQKLKHEQLILINNLLFILEKNNDFKLTNAIKLIATDLAKITSEEDFEKMFSNLKDFDSNSEAYKNENCYKCIEQIEKTHILIKQDVFNKSNIQECNCDWSCDCAPGQTASSNCVPTSTGCGFL